MLIVTPFQAAAVTINSPNPAQFGRFGSSIDSASGLLIVGAPGEPVNGVGAGQVWMFNDMTGSMIRTLVSPNVQRGGQFGWSIELAGHLMIVGAPSETANGVAAAGRVYVFNTKTGSLVNTLISPNAQPNGFFGGAITQANGRVYVGAPFEMANGFDAAGRVYVLDVTTGSQIMTLVSPNAQAGGMFGTRADVSDSRVIVGAPGESVNGLSFAGRAYIFNATTGSSISALATTSAQTSGFFGDSVAMTNRQAFVGADAETVNGLDAAGRVYVFNATTGSLIKTMVDPNVQTEGRFGVSIVLAGDDMIVGAPDETVNGLGIAGRAYVFSATTGTLRSTLISPNAADFGQFALSVGLANGHVYVGAPGEPVNGHFGAGSVYIFDGIQAHVPAENGK